MSQFELTMPKLGESIIEATILKWLKKVGETIKADESLLEIATDKVDTEVPSPVSGVVSKILSKEGETVKVGVVIALISTEENGKEKPNEIIAVATPTITPATVQSQTVKPEIVSSVKSNEEIKTTKFYSPLVLSIAEKEGISMSDLEKIPGTGNALRVTKQDILNFVETRKTQPKNEINLAPVEPITPKVIATTASKTIEVQSATGAGTEIIEMDRMRKIIAERMVESKHISPHVTSFVEADVTNLVEWRNKVKNEFQKREGENLTFTHLFVEAVVKAIKDFPMINVSVNGTNIIVKKYINIGIAVALPSGNLIVPVLKNADRLNLIGLVKAVNDLSTRARNNKLTPDDLTDGTYTISNVGTFGSIMGTPIILQPQVAILATGAITKKPSVIETEKGDFIGIRYKMFLSHSYDHRVVDGALGGLFVKRVAEYLEKTDVNRSMV